jgi:cell division protein FtsI (penicillin-binding protein 3)
LKRPDLWSALTPASIAMGYEVMVTSLQMAMGYAAIANGGDLMRPYLVRRVVGAGSRVEYEGRPQRVRRVVGAETAQLITQALVRVVENGTARTAQLAILPIAGKTGTARKTSGGEYVTGLYTSTFVGFFPAHEPRYVAFVRVDEPMGAFYGGAVAAPVFRQTVEASLLTETLTASPNLMGEMRVPERVVWTASETFAELPLPEPLPAPVDSLATGDSLAPGDSGVAAMAPEAVFEPPLELGAEPLEPYVVDVIGSRGSGEPPYDPRNQVKVPDFTGLSLREAVARAARLGLSLDFSGTGRVATQTPESGEMVARGEVVRVVNP